MTWDEGLERLDRLAAAATAAGVAVLRVDEKEYFAEVRRSAVAPAATVSEPAEERATALAATNGAAHAPAIEPLVLRSDLVGVVRLARPVVSAGSKVDPERDLAYVESLGIRTPVRSAGESIVEEILVEDGQAVDYGQALFAVRPEA